MRTSKEILELEKDVKELRKEMKIVKEKISIKELLRIVDLVLLYFPDTESIQFWPSLDSNYYQGKIVIVDSLNKNGESIADRKKNGGGYFRSKLSAHFPTKIEAKEFESTTSIAISKKP